MYFDIETWFRYQATTADKQFTACDDGPIRIHDFWLANEFDVL